MVQKLKMAQDAVQDVVRDVARGVSDAAKEGSAKALILPIVIFQRRNPRPTHACRPPRLPLGDTSKDVAPDLAQDVVRGVAQCVLGAAKEGSAKVLILPIVILQRRNPRKTHA